ncbi:ATP-binding protein [Burkholderia latens]|uniref:ATP-binding protein n=1 Tax=Burkholderia latens TaxID=488446 RepID=UPI00158B621A|nr:transporter substrate-binding domain-containing protein [Burkholderia latens]
MNWLLRPLFARANRRAPFARPLAAGVVLLILLISHSPVALSAAAGLQLVHLANNVRPLTISPATQAWLDAHQRTFRVGVVPNAAPPFDIIDATGSYTGITADILDRLRSSANLHFTFERFHDKAAMLNAARNGEIDLATTVIQTQSDAPDLRYSRAYFPGQDSLVERNDNPGFAAIATPTVPRLAYVPNMVSADELRKQFPYSTLVPVGSAAIGLTEVAFGRADQYVGNTNISNYLIERLQLLNLSIRRFTYGPTPSGFQLAAPASRAPLIDLADQLIAQINIEDLAETRSRWEGRPNHVALQLATVLSPAEKAWIKAHPVVYFSTEREFPPFLFHDDHGNMAGVTVDMMNLITTQVGIRFKPSTTKLPKDAIEILPVMSATAAQHQLMTTSPYSWSGFAVVSRVGSPLPNPTDGSGSRRIAIPNDGLANTLPSGDLAAQYLITPTINDALNAVADGDVDAAILNINIANYYIAQRYQGQLVVAGFLDPRRMAQIGFGVPDSAPELASIINKVLQGTREAQLNDIRNHWNFSGIPDSAFRPWRQRLWTGLVIAITFGVLLIGWNRSLTRQIRLRKQAEEKLKQQFELQQTLLDSMPFPFFICDAKLCLSGWNQAFAAVVGPALSETGQSLDELARPNDTLVSQLADILHKAADAQTLQIKDTRLRINDREIDVHAWVVPFVSDANATRSLLCGWMDVSERGEMQRAAKRAKEEAEHANHAKSTFLATISHEIRTPMNAILGILELRVRQAEQSANASPEDLHAALDSARSLVSMLDEILDISKIEAGKLTIDNQPTYLNSLTDSMAAIYEEVARKKGLDFHYRTTGHDHQVVTDALRLRQILSNLLSNAIKFTARGKVSLRVRIQDEPLNNRSRVCIVIADSGIGIDPATIPTLLKPYTQAAPQIANQYGGTGLGLPICHYLASALGGNLTIRSALQKGTRVILHFSFEQIATSEPQPKTLLRSGVPGASERFRGRVALIVDDHGPNRIVLSRQLQYLGFDTITCSLANEVLAVLERTAVDVLITDCNMPGMSGFELTQAVREREAAHRATPLIIVGFTASLLPDTMAQASQYGMNACLLKPLALDELADTLQRLMSLDADTSGSRSPSHDTEGAALGGSIIDQVAHLDPAGEVEMLDSLISSCKADLETLRMALETRDLATIADTAHRLHSTADLCRLPVLAQLTTAAEEHARAPVDVDLGELEEILDSTFSITQRLIAKLEGRLQQLTANAEGR